MCLILDKKQKAKTKKFFFNLNLFTKKKYLLKFFLSFVWAI